MRTKLSVLCVAIAATMTAAPQVVKAAATENTSVKKPAKRPGKPKRPTAAYPADYRQPLAYGRDFIEVTGEGLLRGRYRFWGDWQKELASYMADAKEAARARGTPCRKVTMGCIFLKNATITLPDVEGGDGQPMTADYSTSKAFIDEMNNRCMKEYSDYMFAWSGGELEVDWVVETLEKMHWVQPGKNTNWGCQPKLLGDQVIKALAKYKDRGVCMWMFCAGKPETRNPISSENSRKMTKGIGGPPYGVSYTAWPLYGGYTLMLSAPVVAVMVHEFNHRYLDSLDKHEGLRLTRFHGLPALGFSGCGFPEQLYHSTYRFTYQYIIPRDMWRRFTITERNNTPREQFSGSSYAWSDVRNDCWFRLPELTDADLAQLTGIASVKIEGSRKDKDEECRSWTVAPQHAAKVFSPYGARPAVETSLNNVMKICSESCAVLKTATGTWLLVKKELADVYVDMLRLAGKGDKPLPVYGYVNKDVLPLVLVKGPSDMPLPTCEEGFFRASADEGR